MPTVSIAMATFNGARFLQHQLESFLSQTHQPDELVVTDDGSTDETLKILEDFSRRAPFPVLVHRNASTLGYKANFMQCAKLCCGDLIAFSDQDDVWLPEKLSLQYAHLLEPEILLVTHNLALIDGEGRDLGLIQRQHIPLNRSNAKTARPFDYYLGFTLMIKRELLSYSDEWENSVDENFEDQRAAHDQWFCFIASALGSTIYIEEVLASYRQHGSNVFGIDLARNPRVPRSIPVDERVTFYKKRAAAARNRNEQLIRLMSKCGSVYYSQLKYSKDFYEAYSNSLYRRCFLLEYSKILGKVMLFLIEIARGGYFRDRRGMFGLRWAARDMQLILGGKRALPGGSS